MKAFAPPINSPADGSTALLLRIPCYRMAAAYFPVVRRGEWTWLPVKLGRILASFPLTGQICMPRRLFGCRLATFVK